MPNRFTVKVLLHEILNKETQKNVMRDCGFKCGDTVVLVCEKAGNSVANMVARWWKDGV